MNKVSVIIPCYNSERFVAECILSVVNQTHKNIEIICVDDGSSDNSLVILNKFQQKYPDIIKVISGPNQGASKARNIGLAMATGDYIQFLDADDILVPEKVEKQLEGFSTNVDVVVSDREQKNIDLTRSIKIYNFSNILENPLETAVKIVITTCNPLYKRSMVLELKGYNEEITSSQDWEFHIRMVLGGYRIAYVPGVFFINRLVPGSLSSNWVKVSIQATTIIEKLKSKLLLHPMMNDTIRDHIATIYLNSSIYCKNKSDIKKYVIELIFWKASPHFLNSGIKQFIVKIFGYQFLINTLRIFKTQSN